MEDCAPARDSLQSMPNSSQIENHQHDINTIATTAPDTIIPSLNFTIVLSPQQIARVDPLPVAQRSEDMLDRVSNVQRGFKNVSISLTLPAVPDLNEYKETPK
jgi:hypothetical protein